MNGKLVLADDVLRRAVHTENFKYQTADLADLRDLLEETPPARHVERWHGIEEDPPEGVALLVEADMVIAGVRLKGVIEPAVWSNSDGYRLENFPVLSERQVKRWLPVGDIIEIKQR